MVYIKEKNATLFIDFFVQVYLVNLVKRIMVLCANLKKYVQNTSTCSLDSISWFHNLMFEKCVSLYFSFSYSNNYCGNKFNKTANICLSVSRSKVARCVWSLNYVNVCISNYLRQIFSDPII